jgi:hypothetical protein
MCSASNPVARKCNFQILTPYIVLPLLEEKYSGFFVLPALPIYSARTSLGPINNCLLVSEVIIIFVIAPTTLSPAPNKLTHQAQSAD